jgi:zinc/manganese transport system substrate-binding protein
VRLGSSLSRGGQPRGPAVMAAALGLVLAAVAGCATSPTSVPTGSAELGNKIVAVAAENFWGSIASQLGGSRVAETAIITNPDTDPHSYEPTAADARTIAAAQFVIVNGIGYDPWAPKLLTANPVLGRRTLTVGDLLGLKAGDNPHRWYSPQDVHAVIEKVTSGYALVDPAGAAYFEAQKKAFETTALAKYNQLIFAIKAKYAGTPVGASESIVSPLAAALGLKMLTPYSFLKAISEGTEPSAADKVTVDRQIKTRQIKIYVYNSQNATPDVAAQVKEAKAAGIPVTTVTETLTPASATFQAWQVRELQGIAAALAKATGA